MGPQTEAANQLDAMKYRSPGESFRDKTNRVAKALSDNDRHYHELREIFGEQRFLPGGRIQVAMGSGRNVTALNCYVSGTISDSFTDGEGSIMQRAHEAATTLRMGGGIGYDFSTLRPRGALIKKLMSHSSGPVSFMKIFNEICKCTASAGHRRGAQMGMMRCDHPDILEFINAKHDNESFTGFNMSVAVTDAFMECLNSGKAFPLQFNGEIYQEIDPQELWESMMRSTWDWAEPGVFFVDTSNRMNNLWYCETISTTNPCGEQNLPPHGACLLGSINLVKYLVRQAVSVQEIKEGKAPGWYSLDLDQIENDIPAIVRAMDNVIDRAIYPLPAQAEESRSKRRIGIGITGLANALEALGLPYGTPSFLTKQEEIQRRITNATYRASAYLAEEKNSFPLYDKDKYLQSKFLQSGAIEEDILDLIYKYGVRNSHLTSIAPTGTISLTADNVSSSIEPVFAYSVPRPINTPSGQAIVQVEDYGVKFLGVKGRRSSDIQISEHLAVSAMAQKYTDSAVSKTCNTNGSIPWQDFKQIYVDAYHAGAKGITTFNADGKRFALLKSADAPTEGETCRIDTATGRRECS